MIRTFLEIDVDKTTGKVASSVNGSAKGRKNYNLFEGSHIITDSKTMIDGNIEDLVEGHLGKH